MIFRRIHGAAAFVCLLCLSVAAGGRAEWLAGTRTMMGTEVHVELWAENARQGREAQEAYLPSFTASTR